MIQNLDHITGLAFTGMSLVFPGGGGNDQFGRLVYRGLPMSGQFNDTFTIKDAIVQSVQRVCGEAQIKINQVPVVCLTQSIVRILQNAGIGNRIQEVMGITTSLEIASNWLETDGEDVILMIEVDDKSQAVCSLMVMKYEVAKDNARPVYARLTAAAGAEGPLNTEAVSSVLQEAQRSSAVLQDSIGLIEAATLSAAGISPEEVEGLLGAFDRRRTLTCALDSSMEGLFGLAKTIWCISNHIIPGVSGWKGPANLESWQGSAFYVATDSRTWFIPSDQGKRFAGLNILAADGSFTHLILCGLNPPSSQPVTAPGQETLRLFPLAANSSSQFLEKLALLQKEIEIGSTLVEISQKKYRQYLQERSSAEFVACIVAQSRIELLREIGFAGKGIPSAFEKHLEWQTPLGSFFTPQPLGKNGQVSFVYPGAFNSYPGVGRDLFYLFPNLINQLSNLSNDVGDLLNESLLYPRSMAVLSSVDLNAIEARLSMDPITMLISGSCLAVLFTDVLRNSFEIHPVSAFGYSLGEVSMMFASRVWTDAGGTSKALRESQLFRTRLTGPQNAVREFWKLPTRFESDPQDPLWINYLLMTGPEEVKRALVNETHVYLTHINTPRQVAIGGDPASCRRVIARLKCKSIQAPFNYAIHCEPIHSEYDLLVKLHSVPVVDQPGMTLYSASTYGPMLIDQQTIARNIAQELCNCLDFPGLIQRAYDDGARIFIELGAGGNCARWINDTMQGQPHAAYSINRKGVDDYTSILRLMARLVSQQVPVNLSVLYQE